MSRQPLYGELRLKPLRLALVVAVLVGAVLCLIRVSYEAHLTHKQLEADGLLIMEALEEHSRQEFSRFNQSLDLHDVARLIRSAHPDKEFLAQSSQTLEEGLGRKLSDLLFSAERVFKIPLRDDMQGDGLEIAVDTGVYGKRFLDSSLAIIVWGVLYALVLGLILHMIYHAVFARPQDKVSQSFSGAGLVPLSNNPPLLCGSKRKKGSTLLMRSEFDSLTGLLNRQSIQVQLDEAIVTAKSEQQYIAVLCLGLDDFKNINDQYSYRAGDLLLQDVALRLQKLGGVQSRFARLNSDLFVIVQPYTEGSEQAALLAYKVLDSFKEPWVGAMDLVRNEKPVSVRLGATIGIALYHPAQEGDAELLLQQAEQTMGIAKTSARHGYQFFDASVDSGLRKLRQLGRELESAISKKQFHLVFQPQVNYSSRKVVGVEALLRWQHPDFGMVPPDVFIPLAEKNDLIIDIGNWVLNQACQQMRKWLDEGVSDLKIAVNLSVKQLYDSDLFQHVQDALVRHNVEPSTLEVEVTETGMMENIEVAIKNLDKVRGIGVSVAIDDFGTGYSSLSYLKTLPLDKVKIDRSFVRDILASEEDALIVKAVVHLSKGLGIRLIAEGVETVEQEKFLIGLGCDEGQGYWYGKPVAAAVADVTFLRQRYIARKSSRA